MPLLLRNAGAAGAGGAGEGIVLRRNTGTCGSKGTSRTLASSSCWILHADICLNLHLHLSHDWHSLHWPLHDWH